MKMKCDFNSYVPYFLIKLTTSLVQARVSRVFLVGPEITTSPEDRI